MIGIAPDRRRRTQDCHRRLDRSKCASADCASMVGFLGPGVISFVYRAVGAGSTAEQTIRHPDELPARSRHVDCLNRVERHPRTHGARCRKIAKAHRVGATARTARPRIRSRRSAGFALGAIR